MEKKKRKSGLIIMTTDRDGEPVEYTMDDIQKEMDNETEFGKKFKDAMDRVNERIKELREGKKKI